MCLPPVDSFTLSSLNSFNKTQICCQWKPCFSLSNHHSKFCFIQSLEKTDWHKRYLISIYSEYSVLRNLLRKLFTGNNRSFNWTTNNFKVEWNYWWETALILVHSRSSHEGYSKNIVISCWIPTCQYIQQYCKGKQMAGKSKVYKRSEKG